MMSQEAQKGLSRRGRASQNIGFCDRIVRRRWKQGKHTATPSHGDCPRFLVIKKQLKELEDYEKALFEIAARKIDIDLDEGVKYNYQLFGSVLRTIPGLDTQDD
jgi:hypothetical protein